MTRNQDMKFSVDCPYTMRLRAATTLTFATLSLGLAAAVAAQSPPDIQGAWAAERYLMAQGGEHPVEGRIFFSAEDWQVLFFVIDSDGEVRRGSGEGGTYTLDADGLVFTHLFNLSVGEEMRGLPAAELQMVSRDVEDAPIEPTTIEVSRDLLTMYFPSGNRLIFRKRP